MTFNFSKISPDSIKEVHRQAELCLLGTIQLALAADQKATTFTGIMGAAMVALLAASAGIVSGTHPNVSLLASALVTAAVLLFATITCARATAPQNFFVGGYEPKLIASTGTEAFILRQAAEDLQVRIDHNREILERSARHLARALRIALLSVPVGVTVFFVALRFS